MHLLGLGCSGRLTGQVLVTVIVDNGKQRIDDFILEVADEIDMGMLTSTATVSVATDLYRWYTNHLY